MKKTIYILFLFFVLFSCRKNEKDIARESSEKLIEKINKEVAYDFENVLDNRQIMDIDTYINADTMDDVNIIEKLIGNWIIYEKNGEEYLHPNYDEGISFKRDYFFRYSYMGGGYKLSWEVENGKLYIINNCPDYNKEMIGWIDFAEELLGKHDVGFINEKEIVLKQENGNIYKCYLE